MRLIADEMFSPKIIRTISETFLRANWRFESVHNANLQGRADEDWIATFARTGGNVLISGDRAMLKRTELIKQISDTGLIGIYLPSKWAQSKRNEQMSYCLYWWPKIEALILDASPGSIWLTPNGHGGGELRAWEDPRRKKRDRQEANR